MSRARLIKNLISHEIEIPKVMLDSIRRDSFVYRLFESAESEVRDYLKRKWGLSDKELDSLIPVLRVEFVKRKRK